MRRSRLLVIKKASGDIRPYQHLKEQGNPKEWASLGEIGQFSQDGKTVPIYTTFYDPAVSGEYVGPTGARGPLYGGPDWGLRNGVWARAANVMVAPAATGKIAQRAQGVQKLAPLTPAVDTNGNPVRKTLMAIGMNSPDSILNSVHGPLALQYELLHATQHKDPALRLDREKTTAYLSNLLTQHYGLPPLERLENFAAHTGMKKNGNAPYLTQDDRGELVKFLTAGRKGFTNYQTGEARATAPQPELLRGKIPHWSDMLDAMIDPQLRPLFSRKVKGGYKFNGHHVVALAHVDPDFAGGDSAENIGVEPHPAYPYVQRGIVFGKLRTPFPLFNMHAEYLDTYRPHPNRPAQGAPGDYRSLSTASPIVNVPLADLARHIHDDTRKAIEGDTDGIVTGRIGADQSDGGGRLPAASPSYGSAA